MTMVVGQNQGEVKTYPQIKDHELKNYQKTTKTDVNY